MRVHCGTVSLGQIPPCVKPDLEGYGLRDILDLSPSVELHTLVGALPGWWDMPKIWQGAMLETELGQQLYSVGLAFHRWGSQLDRFSPPL